MNNSDLQNQSSFKRDWPSEIKAPQKFSKEKSHNKSVFNVSFFKPENQEEEIIWGTNINVNSLKKMIYSFLKNFNPQNNILFESEFSHYMHKLNHLREIDQFYLVVSTQHIHEYDQKLYLYLTYFPAEVIILFDQVITKIFKQEILTLEERHNFAHEIKIRLVDLREKHIMRKLNHTNLNHLVSLKGIFIWLSKVIPEPREIYFKCSKCDNILIERIEKRKVFQPNKCDSCEQQNTFEIIHNLSNFVDKQYVKFQERPDEVPEGETSINVNLLVYDDLVDECKPGDELEIIGIYRGEPQKINKKQSKLQPILKSYIDVISVVYPNKNQVVLNNELYSEKDKIEFNDDEIEEFKFFARQPKVYERLIQSFAPSLFGMESVKMGILSQLFGGTKKYFEELERGNFRSDVNILLIGDPSTAKSQLLVFVNKISPRGIYTSGKGSSSVGLTASIGRDPQTKEPIIQSGALVLSDHGICCIDEFDKMDEGTQSILHEVMEQQTISIAKLGIVCQLNARTAILAAANPKESRYNPMRSMTYNLNLTPSLISRFDLIYLMLDIAKLKEDQYLAQHILQFYSNPNQTSKKKTNILSQTFLTKYISYAREFCHPKITDEAEIEIIKGYINLRQMGQRKVISATPRQIESIIRLSEARAKMRLSQYVTAQDVTSSINLLKDATQAAAIDPTTGQIDMNYLVTGYSSEAKKQIDELSDKIKGIMNLQEQKFFQGYKISELVNELKQMQRDQNDINNAVLYQALKVLEDQDLIQILNFKHYENLNYYVKKIAHKQLIFYLYFYFQYFNMDIKQIIYQVVIFFLTLFYVKFFIKFVIEDPQNLYNASQMNTLLAIIFYFLDLFQIFKKHENHMMCFLFLNQFISINIFTLDIDKESEPNTSINKRGFYIIMTLHMILMYIKIYQASYKVGMDTFFFYIKIQAITYTIRSLIYFFFKNIQKESQFLLEIFKIQAILKFLLFGVFFLNLQYVTKQIYSQQESINKIKIF